MLVQACLDMFEAPRYLEIGLFRGVTFRAIEAAEKVGVDPDLQYLEFAPADAGPNATIHEVTSDDYFGQVADPGERFDVVFLDGLHSFEQTMRDLHNALAFTGPRGIIVVDDVYPSSFAAALPVYEQFRRVRNTLHIESGAWMGDVYRLLFFLETFHQELTYRTVAEDYGQMVVWRQRRPAVEERSVEAVARMTYDDAVLGRHHFAPRPWREIVAEAGAALGLNPA
ncbi:MAG TPA: class I SAM-dependent methyltransferase [Solirubrobacteraceae bacterium]